MSYSPFKMFKIKQIDLAEFALYQIMPSGNNDPDGNPFMWRSIMIAEATTIQKARVIFLEKMTQLITEAEFSL